MMTTENVSPFHFDATNANKTTDASVATVRGRGIQGGPKNKPLPNDKKSLKIILKPVSEIRFIRQIKVCINKHNIISWY